jgi:protein gp37
MAMNSKIEWTNHTWNPWYGCHKVSQGCKNCYMFREQKMYGRDPNVVQRSKTTFGAPLRWAKKAAARTLVFTCSWSDFFIEEADAWRDEAWEIIRQTPNLTYQILTKRPENIASRLPEDWGRGWNNVWLGVSAEDQETANKRIPVLLDVPAVIRFVSCEPLLELIGLENIPMGDVWKRDVLTGYSYKRSGEDFQLGCAKLHWVIVGGESGPDARPMHPGWVRSLLDQCQLSNTPFFFKQWGEWLSMDQGAINLAHRDTERVHIRFASDFALEAIVWRVGKKDAGHLLGGNEWHEFPGKQ